MVATRYIPSRLFAVSLMVVAPTVVTILVLSDVLDRKLHTVGKIVDAQGYTWYAKDDRTLFHTDVVNTHVVYPAEGGLRRKEFHLFNPVVIEASATASQTEAWKRFFGAAHASESSPTLTASDELSPASSFSGSTRDIARQTGSF
jgi:hypothetical protein